MKKLTKNILSVITLDFPALTEDAEGKLHGGFADFRDPLKGPGNGVNAPCRNIACINNKCNNSTSIQVIQLKKFHLIKIILI